jgi:hypothetical protein
MMLLRKSLSEKYWAIYVASITVLGSATVAVLVQTFKLTYGPAQWSLSYINKWPLTLSVFNFIIDWAEFLSAAAAISVVVTVLMEVREIRRKRALARVHHWAREAIARLTSPSMEISVANRLAEWKQRILLIRTESDRALADARASGNGLESEVDKVLKTVSEFEDYLNDRVESTDAKTLFETTVNTFAKVIKCQ